MFLVAVLILGFPRELPGSAEMREQAIKEGHLPKKDHKLRGRLRDMIPATMQLIKNPTYVFNTLALTAGSLYGSGLSAFMAKYAELKFAVSPGFAGFTLGTVFIVGAAGSISFLYTSTFTGRGTFSEKERIEHRFLYFLLLPNS